MEFAAMFSRRSWGTVGHWESTDWAYSLEREYGYPLASPYVEITIGGDIAWKITTGYGRFFVVSSNPGNFVPGYWRLLNTLYVLTE